MKLEEKRKHSSLLKPYSYYESYIPNYFINVPMHWHGEFEINYVRSGSAEFICADNHFISNEGDIIIVPPNMIHAINLIEGKHQLYDTFLFSADMVDASGSDRGSSEFLMPIFNDRCGFNTCISAGNGNYKEIKTSVETIVSCAKENSAQLDLLLKSELLKLIWLLWDSNHIYLKKENVTDRSEFLRPVITYLNDHVSESVSIGKMADLVHLSQSYFMARFREATGMGMVEYLTQLRVKNACNLLRETEKSIATIAFECGFHNISNFNRQFLKNAGCTPKEFRKRKNQINLNQY